MALTLDNLSNSLQRLPDILKDVINSGAVSVGDIVVQVARSSHRFTSRTGRLVSAIKSRQTGAGAEAYLDTGVAKYAGYIHGGTKYIEADPFLENAVESRQVEVATDIMIEKALEVALNRL